MEILLDIGRPHSDEAVLQPPREDRSPIAREVEARPGLHDAQYVVQSGSHERRGRGQSYLNGYREPSPRGERDLAPGERPAPYSTLRNADQRSATSGNVIE
jgi:hypothetical protein